MAGDTNPVLTRGYRAIGNFKSWFRGTPRSVSNEHPQVYLEKFTSRYSRRSTPMAAFPQVVIGASGGVGLHDPGKLVVDVLELA